MFLDSTSDGFLKVSGQVESETSQMNVKDLSNVDTFHDIVSKKIIYVNVSTDFIRSSSSIRKLSSLQWLIHVFQNSDFCLKAQFLSLVSKTISHVL